ncbi:MAG: Arm DNA-binding domain-containing protein, partial [Acidobacteriota bacterium]
MARTALTDRFVPGVRPSTRTVFFDSKARGLALRPTPSGAKTWAFVYRAAGKPQWLTLGAYPAVTLADARELAIDQRRGVVLDKRDPASEQRAQRKTAAQPPAAPPAVFTFADLAAV